MESMEEKVSRSMLLAFYGEMLTENQQAMARFHWEEDLSLNEIAVQFGVSRQCVHDTLNRVEKKLVDYENRLGLVERFNVMETGLRKCEDELGRVEASAGTQKHLEAAQQIITALLDQEEQ